MIDLDYELWFLDGHIDFVNRLYHESKMTSEQYYQQIDEYSSAREVLIAAGAKSVSHEEGLKRWLPKTDAEILASLKEWQEELEKRNERAS